MSNYKKEKVKITDPNKLRVNGKIPKRLTRKVNIEGAEFDEAVIRARRKLATKDM